MEQKRPSNNGYHFPNNNSFSYSNLFNLDSLMNFQLPQQDEDLEDYASSSQDESGGSLGQVGMAVDHGNGNLGERSTKRKKRLHGEGGEIGSFSSARRETDSNDEDDNDNYGTHISEDHYRSMLGEHVMKYRRSKHKDNSTTVRTPVFAPKRNAHNAKSRVNSGSESLAMNSTKEDRLIHGMETPPEYMSPLKQGGYYFESDVGREFNYDKLSSTLEYAYLDIGEGITYRIPPSYDRLVMTLNLPNFSDTGIEECFVKGKVDLGALATMVGSDKKFGPRSRQAMGDAPLTHESLQAKLKALSASNSVQKFSLQVFDIDSSSIPEGAAGNIKRMILSESGNLQVYYVKVLEKGDAYEIIERALPKKQVAKKDPAQIEKEDMEKVGRAWTTIVRRDFPKHYRTFVALHRKQLLDAKKYSDSCQREVKAKITRSLKMMKGAAVRTRKMARDMLVFWKRVDKEQAELRKKEERDAAEALKREEELREAKRQQQRLNFLLTQTELYSHFMQNKSTSQASDPSALVDGDNEDPENSLLNLEDYKPSEEEEDPEEAAMKREAFKAAHRAVSQQKKLTSAFDNECLKLREAAEPQGLSDDTSIAGSSNIDLLHPSTMPITSSVQTPQLFNGSLKEYQLKGLQWLVNCYEQGLNGILADEMGLGKTIQAIAFLAHLAEEKNIWGPFLVVAPASVLSNWVDEFSRFCPDFKTLPYWGGLQDRTILRKNINPKRLYRREAGFHILITSYQLLVSDEKYFRRVKWQYMVLDEAQAIKSAQSIRWKTLLSFNCRNRLLLTGTPIQNNMAELWALLHFIMPSLFDSHEQFNEWFSKGIENHAEHGGTLNEHQLNRLHAILKPFMLRRVKKDVITEMTSKKEVTVYCKLSSRQQAFYQAIKNKISLAELIDSTRGHLNEKKILNLMNIVIQLRKVCNHPELFERNEGSTYLYFGEISNSLLPPPFGEPEDVYYAGSRNPITYKIPKMVHQELVQHADVPCSATSSSIEPETFEKLFNMFSPDNVHRSLLLQRGCSEDSSHPTTSGSFGFTRLIDLSPGEISFLAKVSSLEKLLFSIMRWDRKFLNEILELFLEVEGGDLQQNSNLERGKVRAVARMLLIPTHSESSLLRRKLATGPDQEPYEGLVMSHQDRLLSNIKLLHSTYTFIPPTRAPPINVHCSDRWFVYKLLEELHHPWVKRLILGFARTSDSNGPRRPNLPHPLIQEIDMQLPAVEPILQLTYKIFGSTPPIRNFDPAKTLTDSGKLQTLDILLKRLRAENHRVLLFAQMTKMLNILEDYMNYRKYRYLRLDGSSTIMDRRDMVRDFQTRSDIFVFLLSTRAGGLGINLTAADTVIFYESDWNPTLDLQAMDRAHRLGQTKEVTVYRLICKETVEEKILLRASQKNTVQQLVMTGGHVQGDLLAPEDVVSLLLDDAQLEQKLKEVPVQGTDRQKKKQGTKGLRLNDEGDASWEDYANFESQMEADPATELENGKATNKKKKSNANKQTPPKQRNQQRNTKNSDFSMAEDEFGPINFDEDPLQQNWKTPKRLKKSVEIPLAPDLEASEFLLSNDPNLLAQAEDQKLPHGLSSPR
ncbi:hypothetical protein AMTRI_Chr01g108830 [Amborella trichopoda]